MMNDKVFDMALDNAKKLGKCLGAMIYLIRNGNLNNNEWEALSRTSGVRAIAEALNINTTLTILSLNSNRIYRSGISALAKTLKINKTLKILNLEYTCIDKYGAKLIANALKQNTTLLKLDLRKNFKFGDKGAKEFANALVQNTTLTELCVGNNNIRYEGATAFAEALKINTTLLKLDIVDYIYDTFNKDIFEPYLSRVIM